MTWQDVVYGLMAVGMTYNLWIMTRDAARGRRMVTKGRCPTCGTLLGKGGER